MSDLVQRLRLLSLAPGIVPHEIFAECADEITRLNAVVIDAVNAAAKYGCDLDDARAANARLREDAERFAANLRGKHKTTGATYAHLIAERDTMRADNARLREALQRLVGAADALNDDAGVVNRVRWCDALNAARAALSAERPEGEQR